MIKLSMYVSAGFLSRPLKIHSLSKAVWVSSYPAVVKTWQGQQAEGPESPFHY